MDLLKRLRNYLDAAYPAIMLRTVEEPRALQTLAKLANESECAMTVWNAREGFVHFPGTPQGKGLRFSDKPNEQLDPGSAALAVLNALKSNESPDPGLLVFCDVHTWAQQLPPSAERVIKDLLHEASTAGLYIYFLGAEWRLPASFEHSVTVVDFSLPDRDALNALLEQTASSCEKRNIKLATPANGEREEILRAAAGLTSAEAENTFALAAVEAGEGKAKGAERRIDARTIYREKAGAVRRGGLLEIIEPDPRGLDAIGGLANLKEWIVQRKKCYTTKARAYGLPSPKGVLAVGVPGTGKSLAAKCIGTALNVPTIRLDLGAMFASLVGESERRMREALAMADAIAPCVLFVDELEKGLAGTSGSGNLDSGVGRRILGTLLTWQQEHRKDVFLFATANQVQYLPPELLRKGRFDEIFSLDLPSVDERKEIAAIHLRAVKRDPTKFDLAKIAKATPDFTGSEIEEVIKAALYLAFAEDREVDTGDICTAAKQTKTISETMAEQIKAIREWGEGRARPASPPTACKGEQLRRIIDSGN